MFSNKKKYDDGYNNIIEPTPLPEKIKEGEDDQFLYLIKKDDDSKDDDPKMFDDIRKNKKPHLKISVLLFFYLTLLMISIKMSSLVYNLENDLSFNYPGFIFSYMNVWLSFFFLLAFSGGIVLAYRFLTYHLQPKHENFFSLDFVKKTVLFVAVTNFLVNFLFVLGLFFINNVRTNYYSNSIDVLLSNFYLDSLTIIFFTIGVFLLFVFLYSLFPKRFYKSRLIVLILSILVSIFILLIFSTGISSVFVYLNFSPAVNVSGQVAVVSPSVNHFAILGSNVIYSYNNDSFDSLSVVSLKTNISRHLLDYGKICDAFSDLNFFVVTYGDKDSCNSFAVLNDSGNFLYKVNFGYNVSLEINPNNNVIIVHERNSTARVVDLTNTSAVPLKEITLSRNMKVLCASPYAYGVSYNGISNNFVLFNYSGKAIGNISENIVDCSVFGNSSKLDLLSEERSTFGRNSVYSYHFSEKENGSFDVFRKIVSLNTVTSVVFNNDGAFIISNNGDVSVFDLNKFGLEFLMNNRDLLINDFKTNSKYLVWKKDFGVSFFNPLNQLLFIELK